MSFEEDFPGLKCEQCNCDDTLTDDLHIHISTIQKNCLDKQVVDLSFDSALNIP